MGSITARKKGNRTYYVYQETYREKINPLETGKSRGSGKSRVRTRAIYLGTAKRILDALQKTSEPTGVTVRQFGLVAAAYQTATEIGLQQILKKNIRGERGGIDRWIYFFVTIINRLDQATSKNKMSQWLKKTILPELLGVNYERFTSQNFWHASDDVLSQKEFEKTRHRDDSVDDPFAGLREDTFTKIEMQLFSEIDRLIRLSPNILCYDTTNFYTYIREPKRSVLANTCHSKHSKHHLKHIGLLMAVEKAHGIPILSRVYPANCHDSKVFSSVLADLIITLKQVCGEESDLVVVLDKGNNSQGNFEAMQGRISWVGALVPSHHKDLIDLDLSEYHGSWKKYRYYRCVKTVMGVQCVVVVTFNAATKRRQEATLNRGIEKLKRKITTKWESYKKPHKTLTAGIQRIQKDSHYGRFLHLSVRDGKIQFDPNDKEIGAQKNRFGKNLVFSNNLDAEAGYLIDTYHEKAIIENDFRVLKDQTIIRFRPIRHWTDTKIRAYAFCCVMALTLIRVMQWKIHKIGYKMSPELLKEELSDIKEVIMVYTLTKAQRKISDRSAVQNKLWQTFKLHEIEGKLLLH